MGSGGIKAVIIITSAIFNLAFGIAGLVVHLQYNAPDPNCGYSGERVGLTLSQWLEGFGIGNIIGFIGILVFALLLDKSPTPYYIFSTLLGLFSFAWMIVGSVVLWRDDYNCVYTFFPLWQTAAACLISIYILIFINFILSGYTRNALKKE